MLIFVQRVVLVRPNVPATSKVSFENGRLQKDTKMCSERCLNKIESDRIFFFDSRIAPAHTKSSLRVGLALISKTRIQKIISIRRSTKKALDL